MAQIDKPNLHFNTKLYTGNGGTQSISSVGFQPDWVWCKGRSFQDNHISFDAVRTATKVLKPNLSDAESTVAATLTSFDSDGFSLGSDGEINANNQTFVSWNWKANGAGSSNTDGNITSTVSSNTTAKFSIVKYTGNANAGATIGHGLGVVPAMMIVKSLDGGYNWGVYHKSLGSHTKYLYLDASNAVATDSGNFDNVPTSSTFLVGSNNTVNKSGDDYIAYCFAEKKGYSKFGKYTGNGDTDGVFIYTGFKPAFYMVKRTDTTGSWIIKDTKRPGYNVNGTYLVADTNIAEATGSGNLATDEYSNGFKMRGTSTAINADGGTYTYLAFGQTLVGSNNIPATAR